MFVHSLLIHVNAYIKFSNEPTTTYQSLWLVAVFIPKNDHIISSHVLRNKKERYNAGKSMHHQCVKGLLFFSHRWYIEAARGQHFSRDEASKPQPRTLYRHTEIDRRRFFSPGPEDETREKQPVHRRNKERTRGTKTKRKWDDEGRRSNPSIDEIGRVGDTRASFSFRGIPRRIVSDSGDLYLPPGPTTFSPDWAHCPWRRSWLRVALTSRIESEPVHRFRVCFAGPPDRFIALIRVTRAADRKEPLLGLLPPFQCSATRSRTMQPFNSSDLWIGPTVLFVHDFRPSFRVCIALFGCRGLIE